MAATTRMMRPTRERATGSSIRGQKKRRPGQGAVAVTRTASVGRKTIEQAGAAGGAQFGKAAAACRMRRVPGFRRRRVAYAGTVVVANKRGALAALGPVAAGPVIRNRECGAVRL